MTVRASGYWAWWNQYGSVPLEKCVERAKQLAARAGGGGVIVKWGFWREFDAFRGAGVRVAIERYVYPGNATGEADHLAEGIRRGAEFAVINAEVEWENANASGGDLMRALMTRLQQQCSSVEMYASVDTRGYRFGMPFQRALAERVAGWFPMIYPKSFAQPVERAFNASLYGRDFQGRPVLPTLQTYDGIGSRDVTMQLAEIRRRGLPGCQAYTIAHATDDEWAAFIAGIPTPTTPTPTDQHDDDQQEDEIDMATAAQLEEQIATLRTGTQAGFAAFGGAINAIKAWIFEHASNHDGAAPSPAEIAQRLEELEHKIAEAGHALGG